MSTDSNLTIELGTNYLQKRVCELLTNEDPALTTISQCKYYIGMEILRGKVWTRAQLLDEFDIEAFDGMSLIVTRISDGACGSVLRNRYPVEDGGHAIYSDFSE